MTPGVRLTPHSRTRRQLPVRIERLRWLRDAARDPSGCTREAAVDDAVLRVRPTHGGHVELRVEPLDAAETLAKAFFGRRYRTRSEQGSIVFIGRPI